MLRNLIYSFCCHILFIAFLFISTFEFAEKISTTKATPLTISFINDNSDKNEWYDEIARSIGIDLVY